MMGTVTYKGEVIENAHMSIHEGFDCDQVMVISLCKEDDYQDLLVFHFPHLTMDETLIEIRGFAPINSDDTDLSLKPGNQYEYSKLTFIP